MLAGLSASGEMRCTAAALAGTLRNAPSACAWRLSSARSAGQAGLPLKRRSLNASPAMRNGAGGGVGVAADGWGVHVLVAPQRREAVGKHDDRRSHLLRVNQPRDALGHVVAERLPVDVRETRPGEADEIVEDGKRRPRPRVAPSSYCGGSHTASGRTCGSPSGLSASTLDVCSSTTTRPDRRGGRFRAIATPANEPRGARRPGRLCRCAPGRAILRAAMAARGPAMGPG